MRPVAYIQEDLCVGCTQCLKVCPVDAIVGGLHWMHTVIESECIGCRLCVDPCPVDCIEIRPSASSLQKDKAKERIKNRKNRLATANQEQGLNTPAELEDQLRSLQIQAKDWIEQLKKTT